MEYEREMLRILESGTALVAAFVARQISPEEFLRRYGDFYYEYALDGHEAGAGEAAVFDTLSPWCGFHEQVQEIVYLVYRSETELPEFEAVGRILPAEVHKRIEALSKRVGVDNLLGEIRDRIGS